MDLAGLTAYAREKYHISEQHKWADFPGFSVLADPATGKWAALLMRQWDSEAGEQIERCDIKCGRSCLEEYRVPWLSGPFRMHGQKWGQTPVSTAHRRMATFLDPYLFLSGKAAFTASSSEIISVFLERILSMTSGIMSMICVRLV